MTTRRTLLASGLAGGLALTGGCLGVLTGSEALEFSAAKAEPSDSALGETGYELHEQNEERIEETAEVSGVERDIVATFWASVYAKSVAVQGAEIEAAAFGVVSMPSMEVLGTPRNPIADMDATQVLNEAQGNVDTEFGELRDITHEETRELSILGEDRDVDVFDATADLEGQEIDVLIHLATVSHEGDLLILFGGHPRQLPEEEINAELLMESIEHPVEE